MTGNGSFVPVILAVFALAGLAAGAVVDLMLWPFVPAGWWMLWVALGFAAGVPALIFAQPWIDHWARRLMRWVGF